MGRKCLFILANLSMLMLLDTRDAFDMEAYSFLLQSLLLGFINLHCNVLDLAWETELWWWLISL